jgi:hypothetical protein
MAKYKIAWMPGDGVGNDVMQAARLVLDRLQLDADYVPCDIGWDFWCKEGNALPDRTVRALKETTCGLFGAITSKPQSEAKEELIPELKDKGLVYFSPIVKLRQMFNLHTNMRPCKSYPGNPLNYRGTKIANPSGADVPIDQVVFRENTEGMYGGVEFQSIQHEARRLHHLVANAVPRHPRNFVFRHWLRLYRRGLPPASGGSGSPSTMLRTQVAKLLNCEPRRIRSLYFSIALGEVDPPLLGLPPQLQACAFARSRVATRFSAPPATINSWAAGLSGGKANDFPSMVSMDLP